MKKIKKKTLTSPSLDQLDTRNNSFNGIDLVPINKSSPHLGRSLKVCENGDGPPPDGPGGSKTGQELVQHQPLNADSRFLSNS
jgi:hypothetical protein